MSDRTVLSNNNSGGPLGLGDPDDTSLRRVELNVLIPKLIRDKAKSEKCANENQDFYNCGKEASILMVMKCRKENDVLKSCLYKWYHDEEFKQLCTEQYLKERSIFRRTGVQKPMKRAS